jgi:RNA polymerase sigma-70 factor (ECF subfamily)
MRDVREALADDLAGSFERLVAAYQDRLYSFALRMTGNPQDAEEVTQDAFVRAYRALQSYPPERIRTLALRSWLYQITLNLSRNRARRRRPGLVSLDEIGLRGREKLESPDHLGPNVLAEQAEQREEIATALVALPVRYRAAVVLRFVEGLRYAEIAAALGQPVGTVKANVHRGICLLRQAFQKRTGEV